MKYTGLLGGVGMCAVTSTALAGGVSFFEDPALFADALGAAGKLPKGSWALENNQGSGAILGFDDPLNIDFPGPYDPDFLLDNLTFQSNIDPFGGTGPNPTGATGLVLANAPTFLPNDAVLANFFTDSFDILSGPPAGDNHTAVGMTVATLLGGGGPLTATVFDKNENVIGQFQLTGGIDQEQFLGILAPVTIGRINLYDTATGAEGITGIEVYVAGPPPGDGAFLDIKPGSCPNPINPKSRGKLPVSLLGTLDFDVSQVDISSLQLSRADGVGGSATPNEGPPGPNTVIDDTGTPFEGELCDCHELVGDGIPDLSMKFITQEVVAALELNDVPGGTELELCVSGVLLDGTPFQACDCVILVPQSISAAARAGIPGPDVLRKSGVGPSQATE